MRQELPVIAAAAMLVLTAFASMPVVAAESVAVQTESPTDVTTTTATLHGNVTDLQDADNVTVWFEYWPAGEGANSSTTAKLTEIGTGSFSIEATGLASDTEYVVVAHAETESGNASAVGGEVTFSTDPEAALAVQTESATDITDTSATLNGELTALSGIDNATVWFEYWVQGDPANSTTTSAETLTATGTFSEDLAELENDTTYAYVTHAAANNTSVTGGQVTFTTAEHANETTNRTWDGEGPFGRWLSGIIMNLVTTDGQPLGQVISDIVTANNPGSEHRSDKADSGGNGPPEHAKNTSDEGQGPPEDKGKPEDAGPPEDKGKPDDEGDGDEEQEEDQEEEDEEEEDEEEEDGEEEDGKEEDGEEEDGEEEDEEQENDDEAEQEGEDVENDADDEQDGD